MLRAYPVEDKNSNKVVLPQSLLKEIHDKKVWDFRPSDKPLIFELSVADPGTGDVLAETHVGVEKFTAPNGKIGLPYKTALSLTKERGIGWLEDNPLIFLRYVELESSPESSMKVQPRGKGFFLEDDSVVQLDIKTVLELTLRDHLVLTEGDWIPLFWNGNRFELVVKELKPKPVIDVLNTDLTVELMPSEETEQSMKEREEAKEKVNNFMNKRELRYKEKAMKLEDIPEPDKNDKDNAIVIRIKLPKGGALQRRFSLTDTLDTVLDFVEVGLYKASFTPMNLPPEDIDYYFNLVYALPGTKKKSIDSNKNSKKSLKKVIEDYEIKPGPLSLSIEMVKQKVLSEEEELEEADDPNEVVSVHNEWLRQADRLEANLEANDDEVDLLTADEINDISEKLTGLGVEPELSQKVARLYGKQVNELISMGYDDLMVDAVKILNQKKGDINAVVEELLKK